MLWARLPALVIEIMPEPLPPRSDDLSKLYPDVRARAVKTIGEARKVGLDVAIFETFRSLERQTALYKLGRDGNSAPIVTNSKPGTSIHGTGLAVDIVFRDKGRWSWDDKHQWDVLGKIGAGQGLEWGGTWKTFVDRPHFQLLYGMKGSAALDMITNGGIFPLWNYLDELRSNKA